MAANEVAVLIIDDRDGRSTQRLLGDQVKSVVRHPNDVTDHDLRKAKLVLVDFMLEDWPERNSQTTPSLKPRDGIALIATLRSNLSDLKATPTAFALNSGVLKDLNSGQAATGREHAIARSIDLEWVFAKGSKDKKFSIAVSALAAAVASLPNVWPSGVQANKRVLELLGTPSRARWRPSAVEAVEKARPPHDIVIANSTGVAVLRWLLHEVLPYPTFLIDERYLANRLRIEPASFSTVLRTAAGKKIRLGLRAFRYTGLLNNFSGERWWRSGIEYWLWNGTSGRSFDPDAVKKFVQATLSKRFEFTTLQNPVVSLDRQLRSSDTLIDLESAIEIRPDGWPPFADSAWIPAEAINDLEFAAFVPQKKTTNW